MTNTYILVYIYLQEPEICHNLYHQYWIWTLNLNSTPIPEAKSLNADDLNCKVWYFGPLKAVGGYSGQPVFSIFQ